MRYLQLRREIPNELIDNLVQGCDIHPHLAQAIAMRGIEDCAAADKFLHPYIAYLTPVFEYEGMREAASRILEAKTAKEKIMIYGDYDCDGICATAILYLFFNGLGIETEYYIPHRVKEGYGINRAALEDIAENHCPDLIITVDCGISSKEDIEYAENELGLEFIVTDHHEPPENLPDCIIVNPKVARKESTFNELCGAGIALRLCEAVGGEKALTYALDLAAIATIGDIVPLVGDNRIIVSYGLKIVNARARQSVKLLLESAVASPDYIFTSSDIAFKIVPRINAIGRLSDPMKGVAMLIDDTFFYVKALVEQANGYNTERQRMTDDLVEDCLLKLEDYDLKNNRVIFLSDVRWEAGVLGIACSKLVNIFKRPVILMSMSEGMFKGSCRSIDGINMYEMLRAVSMYIDHFGGHSMACGLSVEPENMANLLFAINEYARKFDESLFLPNTVYDIEVNAEDINDMYVDMMEALQPCGAGMPEMCYLVDYPSDRFERIGMSTHVKCNISDACELVWFDGAKKLGLLNSGKGKVISGFTNTVYANRRYAQAIVRGGFFEDEAYRLDDFYLSARHAYSLNYEGKSIFNPQTITFDDAVKLSTESIYGVCYLAYNNETFTKFSMLAGENLIRRDIGSPSEENPYNRLILDPDTDAKLQYYDTVVFLDKPMGEALIDYLKLNRKCKVYECESEGLEQNVEYLRKSYPDVNTMRSIFSRVRELILKTQKPIGSISALYALYCSKYKDSNAAQFYIAMYVFFELKIVIYDKRLKVNQQVKTSLDNSVIYNRIREVINGQSQSN